VDTEPAEGSRVSAFLMKCELDQYAPIFLSNGFDTMDALLGVEDAHMSDMGLPRGHAVKLRRHIQELVQEVGEKEYASQHILSSSVTLYEQDASGSGALPPKVPCFYPTDKIKDDVQKSWDRILEVGILYAGEVLYKKLFEIAPVAEEHLPPHIIAKYQQSSFDAGEEDQEFVRNATLAKMFSKIFNAVGCAITGLHDLGKLVPMLLSLGARHVNYNSPEHAWEGTGIAVNMTLREILGDMFSRDVEQVWTMGYAFISSIMIQGLREANAAVESLDADRCDMDTPQ